MVVVILFGLVLNGSRKIWLVSVMSKLDTLCLMILRSQKSIFSFGRVSKPQLVYIGQKNVLEEKLLDCLDIL